MNYTISLASFEKQLRFHVLLLSLVVTRFCHLDLQQVRWRAIPLPLYSFHFPAGPRCR